MNNNIIVSALVSIYEAENYIKGRLEDLQQQTIANNIEIICINSNSPENERDIIIKFKEKYNNILYVETQKRETIYKAWNRGILMASGKYLTNANCDDRLKQDAFEIMVKTLEKNQDISVVYGNYMITDKPNETFVQNTAKQKYQPGEFDLLKMLQGICFPGPQPMWKKDIHSLYGYFDPKYESAGDLEFWLRIAEGVKFKYISKTLGLYLLNPKGVQYSNPKSIAERDEILIKYHHKYLR